MRRFPGLDTDVQLLFIRLYKLFEAIFNRIFVTTANAIFIEADHCGIAGAGAGLLFQRVLISNSNNIKRS